MSNLVIISNPSAIKSTELVDVINEFRKGEGNKTELRHDHFMDKIKKEVEVLKSLGLEAAPNFRVGNYIDKNNQSRPCYELNRDGMLQMLNSESACVRYKTVEYINKLEEKVKQPIKQITSTDDKSKLAEARLKNAKARTASIYLKIANNEALPAEYRQVLLSYATKELSDKEILPLPEAKEKTLSATEVGKILGVSANRIGKITNAHNLKTEQYGKLFHDKSKYSNKEVETFRYYESIISVIKTLLEVEIAN